MKTQLILLLLTLICFTSCKKNDDVTPTSNSKIAATTEIPGKYTGKILMNDKLWYGGSSWNVTILSDTMGFKYGFDALDGIVCEVIVNGTNILIKHNSPPYADKGYVVQDGSGTIINGKLNAQFDRTTFSTSGDVALVDHFKLVDMIKQ